MILLVATEGSDHFGVLSGYRTENVTTVDETEAALTRGDAEVVVSGIDLPATADLVARLRGGDLVEGWVPVVIITEGPLPDVPLFRFDEVVPPSASPERVAAAVERAQAIREYQRAVDELFDECQSRAGDADAPFEETPELRAAREEADDLLGEIVSEPAALGGLLTHGDAGVPPLPRETSDTDGE